MAPTADMLATIEILVRDRWIPGPLQARMAAWSPRSGLGRALKEALRFLPAPLAAELLERVSSCVVVESSLALIHWRTHPAGSPRSTALRAPIPIDLGVVSRKVVTTAGVNYLVDALQNLVEPENLKFHALGTGTNAEAVGDTALQTELTTQYNPDNTRATGTTVEGASANIFRTVGTNTVDAAAAVTEHGVFSASSGGTLLDRSMFSVVNLASSDSLTSTFELSLSAGG